MALSADQRPRIGVTGPDSGGTAAWLFTWLAVRRAGGRAIRITPRRPRPLEQLDGLVIGGGADVADRLSTSSELPPPLDDGRAWWRIVVGLLIAPFVFLVRWLFSRNRSPSGDPGRDRLEASLVRMAMARDMPVLGICRGAQLMAMVAGGSLIRQLGKYYEERLELWTIRPRRAVVIAPGTQLREILGRERVLVNSLHQDAVEHVVPPVRTVARESESDVVQGIEDPTRRFWLGVQWHPEYMPQSEVQQRLFHALVETATQRSDRMGTPEPGAEVGISHVMGERIHGGGPGQPLAAARTAVSR